MHIKFTKAGRGNANTTANYLLDDLDGKGLERPGVEIYEGNPHDVANLANSLSFKNRYTHAIISFAEEDNPSREELENVIEDFKKATFGDLDYDRFSYSFVIHDEENGGKHIHGIIAKVDLESGKQFNPAEPGWQKHYDLLRDAWNHEKGWARPDDPSRARLFSKGHGHYVDAENKRIDAHNLSHEVQLAKGGREGKEAIIERFVKENLVGKQGARTHQQIKQGLQEAGFEVSRSGFAKKEGKHYMTLKTPEMKKGFRVYGEIYNKSFNYEEFKNEQSRAREATNPTNPELRERTREESLRIANEKREALKQSIQYRNERYSRKLKKQSSKTNTTTQNRDNEHSAEYIEERRERKINKQGINRGVDFHKISTGGGEEKPQNEYLENSDIEYPGHRPGHAVINRNHNDDGNSNELSEPKPKTIDRTAEVNFLTTFKNKVGKYHEKAKQQLNRYSESVNDRIKRVGEFIERRISRVNTLNSRIAKASERAEEDYRRTIDNHKRSFESPENIRGRINEASENNQITIRNVNDIREKRSEPRRSFNATIDELCGKCRDSFSRISGFTQYGKVDNRVYQIKGDDLASRQLRAMGSFLNNNESIREKAIKENKEGLEALERFIKNNGQSIKKEQKQKLERGGLSY